MLIPRQLLAATFAIISISCWRQPSTEEVIRRHQINTKIEILRAYYSAINLKDKWLLYKCISTDIHYYAGDTGWGFQDEIKTLEEKWSKDPNHFIHVRKIWIDRDYIKVRFIEYYSPYGQQQINTHEYSFQEVNNKISKVFVD